MPVFFALAFLVRCLGLIPAVIDDDESWFAASGAVMNHPGEFFTRAVDNKPPGTAWYYWVIQHLNGHFSTDPRLARFIFIVLLAATAWLLGRCAARLRSGADGQRAAWVAALGFFLVSPLPTPKLMATTTEGLMLPLISLSVWIWLDALASAVRPRVWKLAVSGLALGAALVLKQTAIFFLTPAFYAIWILWRSGLLRLRGIAVFFAGVALPVVLMLSTVSGAELWYWSYVYPKTVLTTVRGSLFWEWKNLFVDCLLLAAVAWPMSVAGLQWFKKFFKGAEFVPAEVMLGVWALSGFVAVLAGKGLFLHYFLLGLPPFAVIMGTAWDSLMPRLRGAAWGWLAVANLSVCAIAAIPTAGAIWGTDNHYYEKLGARIQADTERGDRVFVWGGNALPLTYADRLPPDTRFITSRFASAPYATDATLSAFQKEFREQAPTLFVDVHERGDSEFNQPPGHYAWLRDELKLHYVSYREPSLPWVTFYRRVGNTGSTLGARMMQAGTVKRPSSLDFASVDRDLALMFQRPLLQTLATGAFHWKTLWRLDPVLRSWFSLENLLNADPSAAASAPVQALYRDLRDAISDGMKTLNGSRRSFAAVQLMREVELEKRTEQEFLKRGFERPMALESRSWWVSLAVVKLQPVMLPRTE